MEIEIAAQWVLYVTEITSMLTYQAALASAPVLAIGWLMVRRPGGADRFWLAARWWVGVMAAATVALSATEAARAHQPAGLAAATIVAVGMAVAWHHLAFNRGKGSWPGGQTQMGLRPGRARP
jgi:hypothetical protein